MGVRGLVKLKVLAADRALLESATLFTDPASDRKLSIVLKNPLGVYWIAAVEGVADRNGAEALRGTTLWIDRDALPTIKAGEYYAADLIGLIAIDEHGAAIGRIVGVEDFGASPLLDIKPDGKPGFYLPFTRENVPGDPSEGRLAIRLPADVLR